MVSFIELAEAAGVHVESLRRHRREGCPPTPATRRGIAAWTRRYDAWRAGRRRPAGGHGDIRSAEERRWATLGQRARALSVAFDLEQRRARYVTREAADDQRRRQVEALRGALAEIVERARGGIAGATASGATLAAWLESDYAAIVEAFARTDEDLPEIDTEQTDDVANDGISRRADAVQN